ncbi:MAG TPA: glycosyltransferase [Phycisphaerae bacterium]|nr:glycosyltransferase [Phycisphaerae bacterium]
MIIQHYLNLWWVGGLEHDLVRLIAATPGWTHRIAVRGTIEPEALGLLAPYGILPTPFRWSDWRVADDVDVVVHHNQPASAPGRDKLRRPVLSVYHGFPASRGQFHPHALNCSVNAAGTEWLRIRQGLSELPSLHPGMRLPPVRKTDYWIGSPVRIGCIASGRMEKFSPRLLAVLKRIHERRLVHFLGYGMAPLAERFQNCGFPCTLLEPRVGPGKWEFLESLDLGIYLAGCAEGFGIAVQEMLAVGLPAVIDARGGLLDQVEDGVNALLASDVPGAVGAIERLLDDDPLRRRLGETASARVAERYGLADFRDRYARAIEIARTLL